MGGRTLKISKVWCAFCDVLQALKLPVDGPMYVFFTLNFGSFFNIQLGSYS